LTVRAAGVHRLLHLGGDGGPPGQQAGDRLGWDLPTYAAERRQLALPRAAPRVEVVLKMLQ
jgi:hypothetical protein